MIYAAAGHPHVVFGITFDELCLITDCNFRSLPKFKYHEDEMRPNDWFFVGKNDVFPEEFINFLAFKPELKSKSCKILKSLLYINAIT